MFLNMKRVRSNLHVEQKFEWFKFHWTGDFLISYKLQFGD